MEVLKFLFERAAIGSIIGFLLGLALSAWIAPNTSAGTVLILLVSILVCVLVQIASMSIFRWWFR